MNNELYILTIKVSDLVLAVDGLKQSLDFALPSLNIFSEVEHKKSNTLVFYKNKLLYIEKFDESDPVPFLIWEHKCKFNLESYNDASKFEINGKLLYDLVVKLKEIKELLPKDFFKNDKFDNHLVNITYDWYNCTLQANFVKRAYSIVPSMLLDIDTCLLIFYKYNDLDYFLENNPYRLNCKKVVFYANK